MIRERIEKGSRDMIDIETKEKARQKGVEMII